MQHFFIDSNIARAKTIDTGFYTGSEYYEASKEAIFAAGWHFVGDADNLDGNGAAYPFTLLENFLNEPLVLTRDAQGTLHCMSNVCTHRGNLLVNKPCRLNHVKCKYHGRQFALDGKFVSMPEFKEVEGFPTEADNLHQLPLFQWGKLLFASLNPKARPEDYFGEMMQRIAWFPIGQLKPDAASAEDYFVNANWALYCENYLEGFHIPFVHAGLNQALDFGEYTTEVFRYSNLQLGIGNDESECFDLPESSPDYGRKIAAYYFWVFPNMMFNFYPWGLSINIVQPTGISSCKVSFLTYVLDATKLGSGAGAGLDTVELEDEEIVAAVQQGIRSRFYKNGRYSVTREQGPHHFHTLISHFMNK